MIPIKDKFINKFYSERNSGRIRMEEKNPKKNPFMYTYSHKNILCKLLLCRKRINK